MNNIIRLARVDDSQAMYKIKLAAHAGGIYESLIPHECKDKFMVHYSWSRNGEQRFTDQLQKILDDALYTAYVIERDNHVCGYIMAHQDASSTHWSLDSLFIDPAVQGSGLGSQLLRYFLTPLVIPCELLVIAGNIPARRLYESYGFKAVEQSAGEFYGAPLDRMRRSIDIRSI